MTHPQQPTREVLEQALEANGCERIKDFYAVGPVQRAAVESFAQALAHPTPSTTGEATFLPPALHEGVIEHTVGDFTVKVSGLTIRQIKEILEDKYHGSMMWSNGAAYPTDGVSIKFASYATQPQVEPAPNQEQALQRLSELGQELQPGEFEPVPSTAGERAEVVANLLMYAGDNGYGHIDYADTMRHAAALLQSTALPERDPSKPAESQGLFRKFDVTRMDGSDQSGGKHHGCEYFVLDVDHDPHAKAALQAYAVACAQSHPQLSADLIARHGGSALIDAVIRKVEYLSETVENCTAMTIINALEEMKASPATLPVGELTDEQILTIWADTYVQRGTSGIEFARAVLAAARSQPVREPKLDEIEQYRMQMAGISTATLGYWKEGDNIHPDYDTMALRDVAKLYVKYAALHEAASNQPARVPLSDVHIEAGRHQIFSTENPYCPCDSKTMRKAVQWAERVHGITKKGEQ